MPAIQVSDELLEFFNKNKIYFSPFGNDRVNGRFRQGENLHFVDGAKLEPYTCYINGSFLYSIGSFSFSRSFLPPNTIVGRYCSIGAKVSVLGVNHPMSRFTTSNITYDKHAVACTQFFQDNPDIEDFRVNNTEPANNLAVIIGHDVWIGEDVSISRGVKVGHGAILAAKAMVTKDVPPYAIVGGNPAKILRYRFTPEQIENLLELQWWDYNLKNLIQGKADINIDDFIDTLQCKRSEGTLLEYSPEVLTTQKILEFTK